VNQDSIEHNDEDRSLELYQDLMDAAKDYLFSVTEEGQLLFSNQHFKDALHLNDHQASQLNFNSILHYFSSVRFNSLFDILSDHEDVILHLNSRKGEEIIIKGNCTTYKTGSTVALRGLFHNITTDFKKNIGLEKSEVKFKMLFEKSLNPILYYDPKGIIDCNEAFVKILGFDHKDELIGRLPSEFSADKQPGIEDIEKAAWKIDNLALQNGGHQFEWMHKKKNGEEFLVSASMSVIELDGRKAFFAMWNDLSLRHKAETAIKASESKAQSRNDRLRMLNDINKLLIQDLDFISKIKSILKSIAKNLSIEGTNISLMNAEMSEVMSYAYADIETGKFYEGKAYPLPTIPGINKLLKGEVYYNENLTENHETDIEVNLKEKGLKSVVSIPISIDDQVSGFLSVSSLKANDFDVDLIFLLEDVAKSVALFTSQYTLGERNRKYANLEESLHKLGTKILSSLNLEEIGKNLYTEVNEIMDAPIFGFGLHDSTTDTLEFKGIVEYGKLLPGFNFDLADKQSLGAICFTGRTDVVVNDFDVDVFKYLKSYSRTSIPGEAPESLVYLPMYFKGQVIGVITAQSYKKNRYKDKNIFILKVLSNYIAIATHNARLFETSEEQVDLKTKEIIMQKIKLQKANYNQKLISEIGRKISSTLDLQQIFMELHEQIDKLMDATIFGIRIFNAEKNEIEYRYEIESGTLSNDGFIPMDNDDNYSVWCLKNNKPIFINDNKREYQKYVKEIHVVAGEMPESLLFQPLYINEEPIGVITVQSFYKNAYNRTHLEMLNNLANYTTTAIKNANTHEKLSSELEKYKNQA
jgi:PAS domain S-box-containing protein